MPRVLPTTVARDLFRVLMTLALAVCPVLWSTPASPASVPVAPVPVEENEEEESSASKSATEWLAPAKADRKATAVPDARLSGVAFPAAVVRSHPSTRLRCSTAADPFRNGLGSPFRC